MSFALHKEHQTGYRGFLSNPWLCVLRKFAFGSKANAKRDIVGSYWASSSSS